MFVRQRHAAEQTALAKAQCVTKYAAELQVYWVGVVGKSVCWALSRSCSIVSFRDAWDG